MNKISSKILKANPVLVVNYNATPNKLVFGSFAKLRDNGFNNHENTRCISTSNVLNRGLAKIRLSKSQINMQKTKHLKFTSDYIQSKVEEYDLGKRRLALIMGKDPDNFHQEDIDEAISYLFPSDLDDDCKPKLKHPDEVFPMKQVIETDQHGRPMNSMYYTGNSHFCNLMHDIYDRRVKMEHNHNKEKYYELVEKKKQNDEDKRLNLSGTVWATKEEIEKKFFKGDKLNDTNYYQIREQVNKLMNEPNAHTEQEFIMKFRTGVVQEIKKEDIPVPQQDTDGRHYVTAQGSRKTTDCEVKLIYPGTGKITINEKDFGSFFYALRSREIAIAPFSLLGYQRMFDVEAKVEYPLQLSWNKRERVSSVYERRSHVETNRSSRTQHAVAMRMAISRALRSFVSPRAISVLRTAGLLQDEIKQKERKMPGRRKARKRPTWKKR